MFRSTLKLGSTYLWNHRNDFYPLSGSARPKTLTFGALTPQMFYVPSNRKSQKCSMPASINTLASKPAIKSICVYIGAIDGDHKCYLSAVQELGKELAERNITLVYGGSRCGLMGVLADAVLANKGKVIGVMTQHLLVKEAHPNLTTMLVVDSMTERNRKMGELADGFIAGPGGLGTLAEFFETWTAAKLKLHDKPLGLLNPQGYYDDLIKYLKTSVNEGFVKQSTLDLATIHPDPSLLLDKLTGISPKSASLQRLHEEKVEAIVKPLSF